MKTMNFKDYKRYAKQFGKSLVMLTIGVFVALAVELFNMLVKIAQDKPKLIVTLLIALPIVTFVATFWVQEVRIGVVQAETDLICDSIMCENDKLKSTDRYDVGYVNGMIVAQKKFEECKNIK